MKAFFVTATGTDIGKTFVTAGLIRHLRAEGHAVSALKPVISGFDLARATESDSGELLAAMARPVTANEIARISPWRFAAPLSPDMAAAREGGAVDFNTLVRFCDGVIRNGDGTLFIEGAGGIMTPLDTKHTMLDWISALQIPLIVVTGTYLGTISHTLTALDVLQQRDLGVTALVINESADSTVPLSDTADAIAHFSRGAPIVVLSRNPLPTVFAEIANLLH